MKAKRDNYLIKAKEIVQKFEFTGEPEKGKKKGSGSERKKKRRKGFWFMIIVLVVTYCLGEADSDGIINDNSSDAEIGSDLRKERKKRKMDKDTAQAKTKHKNAQKRAHEDDDIAKMVQQKKQEKEGRVSTYTCSYL